MPEKQKPGPKSTGRQRVVRYWTKEEALDADSWIQHCRAGIEPTSMLKRWFHSLKDGKLQWQGQIIAEPTPGTYLLQLYDWGWGEPTNQVMVSLSDMKDWRFYDSSEDMRYASEHGAMRKGSKYNP